MVLAQLVDNMFPLKSSSNFLNSYAPSALKTRLGNLRPSRYANFHQEDSSEFLMDFMQALFEDYEENSNSMEKVEDLYDPLSSNVYEQFITYQPSYILKYRNSFFAKLFYYQSIYTTECTFHECGTAFKFESENIVPVEVPKKTYQYMAIVVSNESKREVIQLRIDLSVSIVCRKVLFQAARSIDKEGKPENMFTIYLDEDENFILDKEPWDLDMCTTDLQLLNRVVFYQKPHKLADGFQYIWCSFTSKGENVSFPRLIADTLPIKNEKLKDIFGLEFDIIGQETSTLKFQYEIFPSAPQEINHLIITLAHQEQLKNSLNELKRILYTSDDKFAPPTDTTLEACLDSFISPEKIEYTCPKGHFSAETFRQVRFISLPQEYMIFSLKLFEFDVTTKKVEKIRTKIQFPEKIDLASYLYIPKDVPEEQFPDAKTSMWELYSLSVHQGLSLATGHYYNYSKVSELWYKFDDEKCSESPLSDIKDQPYMAFYRRIHSVK